MANDLENTSKAKSNQPVASRHTSDYTFRRIVSSRHLARTFACTRFASPLLLAPLTNMAYWGIGLKTILVFSQVAGYTLSKFIGIKVVSELSAQVPRGHDFVVDCDR